MRNSLTHFFSVSELGIVPFFDKKAEQISKKTNHKAQFISPEDLYKIIKGAATLIITKWNDDSLNNPQEFKEKISFVQEIIKRNGSIIILNKNLNI